MNTPDMMCGTSDAFSSENNEDFEPSLATRSALDQFNVYMRQVKATPTMEHKTLIDVCRKAYKNKYAIMTVLSQFPPVIQHAVDHYQRLMEKGHKLSNIAVAFVDQSPAARDFLHSINTEESPRSRNKDDDLLGHDEQLLSRGLALLDRQYKSFEAYRDSSKAMPRSVIDKLSDTYLKIEFRVSEVDSHLDLFKSVTDTARILADVLKPLTDSTSTRPFHDLLTSDPIEFRNTHKRYYTPFKQAYSISNRTGLHFDRLLELRDTFDKEHKTYRQRVNQVVEGNLLLPAKAAFDANVPRENLFDYCQEANQGLIIAAERFSYWTGYRFSTYAASWIHRYLMDHRAYSVNGAVSIPNSTYQRAYKVFEKEQKICAQESCTEVSTSRLSKSLKKDYRLIEKARLANRDTLDIDMLVDCNDAELAFNEPNPCDAAEQEHLYRIVMQAISSMDDDKRNVCSMRWGLGYNKPMTLEQIRQKTGLCHESIRSIEKAGIRFLRNAAMSELSGLRI